MLLVNANSINSSMSSNQIKLLTSKKTCSSSGCIQATDGTLLTDKTQILERWGEYIQELFHDNRGPKPPIKNENTGPEILPQEIHAAIKKMKKGRGPGQDQIAIEMLEALEDLGINLITKLANDIYNTGDFPQDLTKSVFIALPK